MGKLISAANMSLDGFLEDETGSFDWSVPDEEVHAFWNEHVRRIGTSGRSTLRPCGQVVFPGFPRPSRVGFGRRSGASAAIPGDPEGGQPNEEVRPSGQDHQGVRVNGRAENQGDGGHEHHHPCSGHVPTLHASRISLPGGRIQGPTSCPATGPVHWWHVARS